MTSIASTTATSSSSSSNAYSGFTTDEFIQVMLAELLNQDPMEPTKTSDMVVNMREVQSLLTSQQEAQRADLSWASQLVGQTVTVSQSLITTGEYGDLVDLGLNPDVGASSVKGTVTSFTVVDNQVWVQIGDYDYPIANVTSLDTSSATATTLSELGASLNGRTVAYLDDDGVEQSGTVAGVSIADDGTYTMSIGGVDIPFSRLRSVA